jgi:hypothetical protein
MRRLPFFHPTDDFLVHGSGGLTSPWLAGRGRKHGIHSFEAMDQVQLGDGAVVPRPPL